MESLLRTRGAHYADADSRARKCRETLIRKKERKQLRGSTVARVANIARRGAIVQAFAEVRETRETPQGARRGRHALRKAAQTLSAGTARNGSWGHADAVSSRGSRRILRPRSSRGSPGDIYFSD